MGLVFDLFLIIVISTATLVLLLCKKSIGCTLNEIYIWMLGNLFSFLAFSILNLFHSIRQLYPRLSKIFISIFLPLTLIYTFIWNVMGTIWIVKNTIDGNHCLNTMELFMILFYQVTVYVLFILITVYLIESFIQNYLLRRRGPSVKDQLLEIYKNNDTTGKQYIKQFINKNKRILSRMKILAKEEELIKKYYSKSFKEMKPYLDCFCRICMTEYDINDTVCRINCMHFFHYQCLINWFRVKPKCPFCSACFRESLLLKTCVQCNCV